MENSYVERRNGSIRRELLNAHLFQTLEKARYQAEIWR
jgi:putative transposase